MKNRKMIYFHVIFISENIIHIYLYYLLYEFTKSKLCKKSIRYKINFSQPFKNFFNHDSTINLPDSLELITLQLRANYPNPNSVDKHLKTSLQKSPKHATEFKQSLSRSSHLRLPRSKFIARAVRWPFRASRVCTHSLE